MSATPSSRAPRLLALAALAVVALTALDLGTKTWAESALTRERTGPLPALCVANEGGHIVTQRARTGPVVLIGDILQFEYAENCGAAFGLLRTAPAPLRIAVFGLAALSAVSALFWMLARGRGGPYFVAAVPFVAAGALGNLADRMRYGYVVDFIHFEWPGLFDYPTFNVADIVITIGVICWIIDAVREGRSEEGRAASPAEAAKSEST